MRTTIDIDEVLLQKALSATRVSTKKRVVEIALTELLRKKHRQRLKDLIGKYDAFALSQRDLREMRGKS